MPARPLTAYVANSGGHTVTPINIAINKAGQPVKVGPGPVGIAITPNGKLPTLPTAACPARTR